MLSDLQRTGLLTKRFGSGAAIWTHASLNAKRVPTREEMNGRDPDHYGVHDVVAAAGRSRHGRRSNGRTGFKSDVENRVMFSRLRHDPEHCSRFRSKRLTTLRVRFLAPDVHDVCR